jgi:hypothetical protein
LFHAIYRGSSGRHALPAKHTDAPTLRLVQENRHLTPKAVEMRFDDLQCKSYGDSGVEGITAFLQNAHASGRAEPMGTSHDTKRPDDLWAGGEGRFASIGPIGQPEISE